MLGHLDELCSLFGVSGDEGAVRKYIAAAARPYAKEIYADTMGNLYVHKPGKGKRVMVCAHMDEVGMIVTGANPDGTLEYCAGLSLVPEVVYGKQVRLMPSGISGYVRLRDRKDSAAMKERQTLRHRDMCIYIGAESGEAASAAVAVGSYVTFDTEFSALGRGVKAKALDDRVGCALMLEIVKRDYPCDMYLVFTVQEENGMCGARAAAHNVKPDIALVLEGTTANDGSIAAGGNAVCRLGDGPAITFMDGFTTVRENVLSYVKGVAEEHGIKYQLRQGITGATDAARIHRANEGCAVAGISVPCRYIHSPCGVADASDMEEACRFIDALLRSGMFSEVEAC